MWWCLPIWQRRFAVDAGGDAGAVVTAAGAVAGVPGIVLGAQSEVVVAVGPFVQAFVELIVVPMVLAVLTTSLARRYAIINAWDNAWALVAGTRHGAGAVRGDRLASHLGGVAISACWCQ